MIRERLSNSNNSSITLTTLITFILFKNVGYRSYHAVAADAPTIRELTRFKKLSQEHTVMLNSDLSRKAHANFQNYIIFVRNVFFQHIDVKLTSISCKIEVHIETNLRFSVSIDVFNHFNATNIKIRLF